jgi:hypothetical protein
MGALFAAGLLAGCASAPTKPPDPPWFTACKNPAHPANGWPPLTPAQVCAACPQSPEVALCNPNSWDCAASVIYAPGDGGNCIYAPHGPCDCPVPGGQSSRGQP